MSKNRKKRIENFLQEGSIVWVKYSNGKIHCGQVEKIYPETENFFVFNFDEWSVHLKDYSDVVRVGVTFFTDEYKK